MPCTIRTISIELKEIGETKIILRNKEETCFLELFKIITNDNQITVSVLDSNLIKAIKLLNENGILVDCQKNKPIIVDQDKFLAYFYPIQKIIVDGKEVRVFIVSWITEKESKFERKNKN